MMRPDVMGTITWIAENGDYCVADELIEIEFQGKTSRHT
jgi:vacuolar-type H+-ATPase catalytic subunit A/Vma1